MWAYVISLLDESRKIRLRVDRFGQISSSALKRAERRLGGNCYLAIPVEGMLVQAGTRPAPDPDRLRVRMWP